VSEAHVPVAYTGPHVAAQYLTFRAGTH